MKFLNLQQSLNERIEQDLYRQQLTIKPLVNNEVSVAEQLLINFSSNDYLGLTMNQQAVDSMVETAKENGVGSGGSHLICGHQTPHQALENSLAEFVGRDAALTFSCGYMANLGILQTLGRKGDLIVADKLNHASLIDGVRLSSADSTRYAHCNMDNLAFRLSRAKQNKFVVTDSVFSMDGDIAPLKEIVALCEQYNAILIVDDAHGLGVLGDEGRGVADYFGLSQKQLPVLMATLGKALGGYGAFVAGEKELVDYLRQFCRNYIYTTAMPAAIASANLANLNYLRDNSQINKKLKANIDYFRQQSTFLGKALLDSNTPIQPVIIGANNRLSEVNKMLRNDGLLVGAIRPPTVAPDSARLRITLSASHSKEQIDLLLSSLSKCWQKPSMTNN